MFQQFGPVGGLVVVAAASAALGVPFLLTRTGRRAVGDLGNGVDGDPLVPAGVYVGLTVAYAGLVVLVGESASASNAGAFGLTVSLLLPFAFGVAAATAWLPLAGVEWRPGGSERTDATVTFTAFLAVLTASTAGGWLLVG